MKINSQILSIMAYFVCSFSLQAEIQRVVVHWKGITCNDVCVHMLVQKFQASPAVSSVALYPAAQTIELVWRPTVPFSYQAVKFPMQSVGPGIEDLRVKVRGVVQFQNGVFWVISVGDNTPFALFGSILLQPNATVPYYTPQTHPLDANTQLVLTQAMQQGHLIVVEGPLLLPERAPPLMIMVTNLQIVQPEQRK